MNVFDVSLGLGSVAGCHERSILPCGITYRLSKMTMWNAETVVIKN
jgi:hypothetical protein